MPRSCLKASNSASGTGVWFLSHEYMSDERDVWAKKELKRVLRGYYKSDADPSKPKNFLEKALAKVNATVEEAAALAGCNVEIIVSS